jgi:hypothetical protein
LSIDGHIPFNGEPGEKLLNFNCTHVVGMTLLMKQNELFDPEQIGFFGANTIARSRISPLIISKKGLVDVDINPSALIFSMLFVYTEYWILRQDNAHLSSLQCSNTLPKKNFFLYSQ